MGIEIVSFNSIDSVELGGILYKAENKSKRILIVIHGMSTNCFKYRDRVIAEKINKLDIDMLSFNNRGHDLVSYIKKQVGESVKKELAGTSYEEISECYNDIVGAIEYVRKLGYEEIYILGHSLGCTKAIYTYNKLSKEESKYLDNIKGVLLLSLVDIPKAIQIYLRDGFPAMVTHAKNMQKEGMEEELMPKDAFIHPISVRTFIRYATDNKDIDFAKYSDDKYDFKELNNIKCPLFMRWGNNKEMIIQRAEVLCDMLKKKVNNRYLDIDYIDGANHSYDQKEEILAEQIKSFLQKI